MYKSLRNQLTRVNNRFIYFILTVGFLFLYFLTGYFFLPDYYHNHQVQSFWLNVCLVNLTFMGDGWFALALVAWMAYKRKAGWKNMLIVWMLVTGLVQGIQNLWPGTDWTIYVEQGQYLFFADKTAHLADPGMISGHAAMAVAMGACLAGMSRSAGITFLYAFLSAGVAASRLFLSGQGQDAIWRGVALGIAAFILARISISIFKRLSKAMSAEWQSEGRREESWVHSYPEARA